MVAKDQSAVGKGVAASARGPSVAGQPIATLAAPSDPYLPHQWHLIDRDFGLDLNVRQAWRDYSGSGVSVGVFDDGVEHNHPDLDGNYDQPLTCYRGERHDPSPQNRSRPTAPRSPG